MNDKQSIIKLTDAVARNPLVRLNASASVDFLAGEHIAIVAPNGAGKSLLVDMLTGKFLLREGTLEYDFRPAPTNYAYKNIKYIGLYSPITNKVWRLSVSRISKELIHKVSMEVIGYDELHN